MAHKHPSTDVCDDCRSNGPHRDENPWAVMSTLWDDLQPISIYTRAQAIADGTLVDMTPWARKAGFKYPLACTATVWHQIIADDETPHDVFIQRIGPLLADLRDHARKTEGDRFDFSWPDRVTGVLRDMYCLCGPGDDAAPVLTLMFDNED